MIQEMMKQAEGEGFVVKVVFIDGDLSSHNAISSVFPKAELARCNNHQSKNFHAHLLKIFQFSCKCSPKCRRISKNLISKAEKAFQALLGKIGTDYAKFSLEIKNFPRHYSNDHSGCLHHPLEVNEKPYKSRIFFTCEKQKQEFIRLCEEIAKNPQDYCSAYGKMSTNMAESLHGDALRFRNKKIPLHASHHKLKTDMAFLQRNLGEKWKEIYLAKLGLSLPPSGLQFLDRVFREKEKKKEKSLRLNIPRGRHSGRRRKSIGGSKGRLWILQLPRSIS